jgi:hypothetical protein
MRNATRHHLACDPGSQCAKRGGGRAFHEAWGPHPHA